MAKYKNGIERPIFSFLFFFFLVSYVSFYYNSDFVSYCYSNFSKIISSYLDVNVFSGSPFSVN